MSSGNSESGEPNLTPILDMVFQLITFFMLVINFKAASLDMSLKLPVLGSARPVDNKGQESILVLNVDAEGRLMSFGSERDIPSFIAAEARVERDKLAIAGKPAAPGTDLPTTVIIRADRAVSFKLFNRVLTECQLHGFRKFSLRVMNAADGGTT